MEQATAPTRASALSLFSLPSTLSFGTSSGRARLGVVPRAFSSTSITIGIGLGKLLDTHSPFLLVLPFAEPITLRKTKGGT